MTWENRSSPWYLIIPVALFLLATVPNLDLPGIQYDEVYYVPPAAALLKAQYAIDYVKLDPSVIHIAGRPIPLMFNYYTSFLRTYLTLPLFALFGIEVETIRLSSIALGTVALAFFVAFTRRLTGRSDLAFAAGLFLALDPGFVAYTHNDYVAVSTMMAWKGIALWALLRWWQGEGTRWLALATFFVGLGITDRASFLWIPMALVGTFFLVERNNAWKVFKDRMPRAMGASMCVASGLFGGSIFLAFNVATMGGSFLPMMQDFKQTSGGVDNLEFLPTLYMRLQMLTDLLSGEYLPRFILGDNSYQTTEWHFSKVPLTWLVPFSFIYFTIKVCRDIIRGTEVNRIALFLVGMSSCIVVLTCFTPTVHRGHQLLMLYPFPHILAILFLNEIRRSVLNFGSRLQRLTAIMPAVALGLLLVLQSAPIVSYHAMLVKTGGRGVWSDAIYAIVDEADRQPDKTYVCMDWGFNANILSLTKNRVQTVRSYETSNRKPEQIAELFNDEHRFLVHAEGSDYMSGGAELLRDAARLAGTEIDTVRVFNHRAGDPVAYMLRIVK